MIGFSVGESTQSTDSQKNNAEGNKKTGDWSEINVSVFFLEGSNTRFVWELDKCGSQLSENGEVQAKGTQAFIPAATSTHLECAGEEKGKINKTMFKM